LHKTSLATFYEAIKNACPTMKVIAQTFLQEAQMAWILKCKLACKIRFILMSLEKNSAPGGDPGSLEEAGS